MSDSANFEAAFKTAVDRAARELSSESEGSVNDHPDVDALVDFQEGHLAGDDAERVKRHLADCPRCARELSELESFGVDEPADSALQPSPEQTAEDWARFQVQIDDEAAVGEVLEMTSASLPSARSESETAPAAPTEYAQHRRAQDWLPMAASLLIGLIGVGFWIASQRTEPAGAPPIPRNPYAFDLVPDGENLVRDAATVAEVVVPAGMDALLPRLNLGDQTPFDAYRAEVANNAGAVVWSQGKLQRQPAGQFVVVMSRAAMPAGTYRLSVYGLTDGNETVLAIYTFELSYAPEP